MLRAPRSRVSRHHDDGVAELDEYPERFCVAKAELMACGGLDGDGVLCDVADILMVLEKGLAKAGVGDVSKLTECIVFVLDVMLQVRRGELVQVINRNEGEVYHE